MLTKLFLLIVLYANVICTASFLDHFVQVGGRFEDRVLSFENIVGPLWKVKMMSVKIATNRCAEECYLGKYICKSFVILRLEEELTCLKFGTSSKDIVTQPGAWVRVIQGVYDIHEQRKFPLKDISQDMKVKSGEEWAKDIFIKYGGSSVFHPTATEAFYLPLLLLCRKIAMLPTPPKAINFENNILSTVKGQEKDRTENGESKSKYRKMNPGARENTPTEMISMDLDSWTVPSGRSSSPERIQNMALTFLQILGENIEGITTDFNEKDRYLIFKEKDMHLIVGFPRVGEYIIIWGEPPTDENKQEAIAAHVYELYLHGVTEYSFENNRSQYSGILSNLIRVDFTYDDIDYFDDVDVEMLIAKLVLQVAGILLHEIDVDDNFSHQISTTPFIRDLMAIVVSNVYEKNWQSNSVQSRLSNRRLGKHFVDTIITTNNDT